jgi:hypothetical protein
LKEKEQVPSNTILPPTLLSVRRGNYTANCRETSPTNKTRKCESCGCGRRQNVQELKLRVRWSVDEKGTLSADGANCSRGTVPRRICDRADVDQRVDWPRMSDLRAIAACRKVPDAK